MHKLFHSTRIEDPVITSLAALIELKRVYAKQELQQWFIFKRNFFAKRKPLTCHYCGKSGLRARGSHHENGNSLGTLATVDHVIPTSKGGAKIDESNCVVACFRCNQRKGDE